MFISFLRTIILYFVIVLTVRLMGKRQLGEMEPSELVVAILISDLAAVPMQDIGIPMLSGIIPIITLLSLEIIISELSLHSAHMRSFLCGKPVMLICNGVIDQAAMRKNRLTTDELSENLRSAGILDIKQVQYAILETNGTLSTFLYPQYAPLTANDAGKRPKAPEFPVTIIGDGRIMGNNLEVIRKSRRWLERYLKKSCVRREEIFWMTATKSGNINLIKKQETKK